MDDEDAAALEKGRDRGLSCMPSAGVEEPRGLGAGDGFADGIAEGEGGSKSDMPSLCSDVSEGI